MASSRDNILEAVKKSQPEGFYLEDPVFASEEVDKLERFRQGLETNGSNVYTGMKEEDVVAGITSFFPLAKRVVSVIDSVRIAAINEGPQAVSHSFEDVDVVIIRAQFGVAENGAVWVTDEDLYIRVLPFICKHLVVIVNEAHLVGTMQDAYDKIGHADYGFGVFIAGPSKTADIEQSLVLGAHGPLSAHVFMVRG